MTAVPRGIFNLSFNFDKSWLANLADRRYRGTRCLFANAHRALMNLDEEARQEARRIEIRPDSSYFFSPSLSFFLFHPPPFPLSFHYFLRDCRETIQPTSVETGGPIFLKRSESTFECLEMSFSLLLFEYPSRELILSREIYFSSN